MPTFLILDANLESKIVFGVLGFTEYKDNFSFVYLITNHKRCPLMQWRGQLLQQSNQYFPREVQGEKDWDGPGQERRNTCTSHSSSRMEDSLLARSRLSSCTSTSLQQQRQQCIYLMYLCQIQIFCLWFGLASSSCSCSESS